MGTIYKNGIAYSGSGVIDQTYDATSTNAQSGTAVAEAVSRSYTKQETDDLIANELAQFDHLDYQIVNALPTEGEAGVRYLVKHPTDAQYEEFIYVNGEWRDIGSTADVDLSSYYNKTETDALLADKQDVLVSGTNIKTVNGNSLLGAGNLVIRQGVGDSYDSNDMPSANEVKQRIDNHDLLYIDGNWLITSYYNESSIFYIRSEYANTVREYAFEFNNIWDAPLPAPMTIDEFDSIFARATANYGPAPASGYFNYGGDGFIWIDGLDDGIRISAKSPGTSSQTKTKEYKIPNTNYEMASDSGTGNVVQVGSIDIYGTQYGVYEFFYNTPALPNTKTEVYSFATLLADYTIYSFIEAVGVTDTGIHIGSGRTDGTTQIAVQQFSKNNKTMTIRTYQNYSTNKAVMRIQFIGTKTA